MSTSLPRKSSQRYLPHPVHIRFHACKLYRNGWSVREVCRRYKISKASLMRWNKRFDGTQASLEDRSKRPKTPHPTAHTDEEIRQITNYLRRNPNIGLCELYGKLRRNKNYSRHIVSLYRVLRRLGYYQAKKKKKKKRHTLPYNTPKEIGVKWQIDVKFVPKSCYVGVYEDTKFYQYTCLEEASRKRFLYAYKECSSYTTVDFVQRAIRFFGYQPQIIQTDNGAEFCHPAQKSTETHAFYKLCQDLKLHHQRIRPRTPEHNGKVERSHRSDNERFYSTLKFYSYDDLKRQMKSYNSRSNQIPMRVLNYSSPNEVQKQLSRRFR